jgi:hypothetical protein
MMRWAALVVGCLWLAAVAGCGDGVVSMAPEPARAVSAARGVVDLLEARDYDAIYDAASPELREANTREAFAERLRPLESFGKLERAEQVGGIGPGQSGDTLTVPFDVRYVLGEGRLEVALRADPASGAWRLTGLSYDVGAATFDPPYPATQDGADKLAHRFMFLWQTRRYDDLTRILKLGGESRVRGFLARLEAAGPLLTMERKAYHAARSNGGPAIRLSYDLTFANGKGYVDFTLVDVGAEWRIDDVKYDVEYLSPAP